MAFTPVYDIVTTQAYTGHSDKSPGRSIEGRRTLVEVGRELIELGKNESAWHGVAKNMVHAWNAGMSSLRDPRTPKKFMGLTEDIARAGFCDADKPPKAKRLGESQLLGRRTKA